MVGIDDEAYGLESFCETISANAVLKNAFDNGRAFGAFKKFLLLVHISTALDSHLADEIPVSRTQRKDEIQNFL
jgi:hypothetical protein